MAKKWTHLCNLVMDEGCENGSIAVQRGWWCPVCLQPATYKNDLIKGNWIESTACHCGYRKYKQWLPVYSEPV